MADSSTLSLLARRLNWAGFALVVAAGLAFIWAVGFTQGVDGLLEGLAFAAIALFLPGMAILWVAWIIGGAAAVQPSVPATPRTRAAWLTVVVQYAIAALAVVVAALARWWLDPYVGNAYPYITFFLAVVVATWVGGFVPGVLSVAASAAIVWTLFGSSPVTTPDETGRWIGAALFFTIALAICGITSALRVTRRGAMAMRAELDRAASVRDDLEQELWQLADESPDMRWLCSAEGRCTYVNAAWQAFTGQAREAAQGDGWQEGIHPDDANRWREAIAHAARARGPLRIDYRRRRHDGAFRRVVDEAAPRLFRDGSFAGYLGRTTEPAQRTRAAED
jgi:PAS domain S-box-containing protein